MRGGTQEGTQIVGHGSRFLLKLQPGHPHGLPAGDEELAVAQLVALEGRFARVHGTTVELGRQPLAPPETVDFDKAPANRKVGVEVRTRQPVRVD